MVERISRRQALILGGGALAGAATLGSVTARPASAATDWIRLPVVTANIGRDRRSQREAAIRAVRTGVAGDRPIVGWQEIREGDAGEPEMISRHFGSAYQNAFLHHDRAYRVPISVPRPWRVVDSRATRVHGVIRGWSPPRWINEVVVEHQSHPGLTFVLINTHYVANAYNGKQRPDLRDNWDDHRETHRRRVMANHDQGRLVIWTADTNRPGYGDATGQDGERRAFHRGIDRINWLPGDGTVKLDLVRTKEIPMDVDNHDARVAIFRIRLAG